MTSHKTEWATGGTCGGNRFAPSNVRDSRVGNGQPCGGLYSDGALSASFDATDQNKEADRDRDGSRSSNVESVDQQYGDSSQ